jgi:hypothetical protein
MVAARVRDGGGTRKEHMITPVVTPFAGDPGAVYAKCLEEVQAISCATLFAPVTRCEAVQAMSEPPLEVSKLMNTYFSARSSSCFWLV